MRKCWIKVEAGCERFAVCALDDEQDNRAVAICHHRFKFSKMFQRPRRNAIGKLREAGCPH